MPTLSLTAPCKINYRLDVLRRRPDGYHDLRMIMQRINLCDDITITLTDQPGVRVTCGSDGVPDGPGNIAWRAADHLLRHSGKRIGIDITIEKNIPVAAGLGGGSSDAASVLMGVNELLTLGLSDEELMAVGVKLGADVPFFIFKQTALAEGIGDILTPLNEVAPAWVVLVNPRVPVSTAWVYGNVQLTDRSTVPEIPRCFGSIHDICAILANDLEAVTVSRYPVIQTIKELLMANGASGALMSGSGPTVFGIFASEETARNCAQHLKERHDWFCVATTTI